MRTLGSFIAPRFFEVTGMRIHLGRELDRQDVALARPVAVINQTMARRFFGGDAIGKRFERQGPGGVSEGWFEVVGVAADAKYRNLREEPLPTFYVPFAQKSNVPPLRVLVEVRTAAPGLLQESVIRRIVRDVDSAAAANNVHSMGDLVDRAVSQERLLAVLATLFGILALAVSSIGVYGVRAFTVSSRTKEIGIRVALGASGGTILRSALLQGAGVAWLGVALGMLLAMPLTRYVEGLLYEVPRRDTTTLVAVSAVLSLVTVVASYVPARRATKVDPAAVLRHE